MRAPMVAAVLSIALIPTTANATLRSPHLTSSCSAGYTYQETTFVNWTVEGCSKDATLQNGQTKRKYFRGHIEVNGMIIELPHDGPDLTATVNDNGSHPDTGTLVRSQSASIVLDP